MLNLTFKKASIEDIKFIARSIIEAEKSGTNFTTLQKIFNIDEAELYEIILKILASKIPGSEYFIKDHYIAQIDKQNVASIATWIEAEKGLSSNFIKISIFNKFFKDYFNKDVRDKLKLISSIDIARNKNALQIESVYTCNEHRGKGISDKLIDFSIKVKREKTGFNKVQIVSVIENTSSANVFIKSGFVLKQKKISNNNKILDIFPGTGKILWEKNYD